MKGKYFTVILLSVLILASAACKKALDQPVLGDYQSTNFFISDANAILSVNAAYAPLSFTDPARNAIWVLGDIASDDVIKGGSEGDQADFGLIDNFNIIPTNSAVEAVWARNYDGVFKTNVVIDGLPESNKAVSDATKKSVIAQAKFLRAYYYFILTSTYGNIPLRLKVESPEELQSPAIPQAKIYEQIEADCQAAAADLPATWAAADLGRVTKGAALALLAKTYLFEKKWALAAQTAQAVEALGYELLPNFSDNFKAISKNNKEAIFSIQHASESNPILGNGLNQWMAPRSQNGYGFFFPTQSLVDNFEVSAGGVDDPRLDYTVGRVGHPWFDVPFEADWSSTGYLSKKHIQPLTEVPANLKGNGNLNYQAIRFAEVLLIEAEAFNEAGNSGAALTPLNRVRKRARESYSGSVPAGLLPDITTNDQGQLRDIIRIERRSELALEFHRYYDVIRYGKDYATNALRNIPNFNYDQYKFFPIPQSERNANKKLGQ